MKEGELIKEFIKIPPKEINANLKYLVIIFPILNSHFLKTYLYKYKENEIA